MYGLHGRDLPPLPKAALFRTDVRGKFKTGINGCMHISLVSTFGKALQWVVLLPDYGEGWGWVGTNFIMSEITKVYPRT